MNKARAFSGGVVLCLVLVASIAMAKPVKGYYPKGKGGMMWATNAGYPPVGEFKKEMFDLRKGVFYVEGGFGKPLFLRAINQGLKTFQHFLGVVRKKNASVAAHFEFPETCWFAWVSHDEDGKKLIDAPPAKVSDFKQAQQANRLEYCANVESGVEWIGAGLMWEKFDTDFKTWLSKAKPGHKAWTFLTVGYRRKMPEAKRFEDGRWHVPTTDVLHDTPLATGTIVVK